MQLEPNARLIISCLEGHFPSVPLTRISHYNLIQKDAGLRAVHSTGSCAVGRAPDLCTGSRCVASAPKSAFCSYRRLAMSHLGVLTLDLQLKAFEVRVECAMSWLQNNSFLTCLHLCVVLKQLGSAGLQGLLKNTVVFPGVHWERDWKFLGLLALCSL